MSDFVSAWIVSQLGEFVEPHAGRTFSPNRSHAHIPLDLTAELTPVALAASVLGRHIDIPVLARLFSMDPAQLASALSQLATSGVLTVLASPTEMPAVPIRYRFANDQIHGLYYAALPEGARNRLHLLMGHMLSTEPPSGVIVEFDVIAWHFAQANAHADAFHWWCQAAKRSIASAATQMAVTYLKRALFHCEQDRSAVPLRQECAALQMLGPLQAQLHGSGSPIVAATYARCLAITQTLHETDPVTAFDVLWGLQACQLVAGAIATALQTGQHLLNAAMTSGQEEQLLLAARMQGLTQLLSGNLQAAVQHFSQVVELYAFERHAHLRLQYASDQGAVALAHLAWAETIAGNPLQSESAAAAALDLAARLDHAHTSAHVTCVLAARAQTIGDYNASAPLALAGRAVAIRYKFPYWVAWADIILGWCDGVRQPAIGAARIDRAIDAYRHTGAGQALPYAYLLRAQMALGANDRKTAIAAAQAGSTMSRVQGLHLYAAELLRVEAEARWPEYTAQQLVAEAIHLARAQGALLFLQRAVAVPGTRQHQVRVHAHRAGRLSSAADSPTALPKLVP